MPNGVLAHEIVTYVFAAGFTVWGAVFLVRAILDYPNADPDLRVSLTGYIFGGVVLLLIGLGSLAGVGIGRYDHFYDTHRAPWPAVGILRPIAFVIAIIGVIVVGAMNRRRYQSWE